MDEYDRNIAVIFLGIIFVLLAFIAVVFYLVESERKDLQTRFEEFKSLSCVEMQSFILENITGERHSNYYLVKCTPLTVEGLK